MVVEDVGRLPMAEVGRVVEVAGRESEGAVETPAEAAERGDTSGAVWTVVGADRPTVDSKPVTCV